MFAVLTNSLELLTDKITQHQLEQLEQKIKIKNYQTKQEMLLNIINSINETKEFNENVKTQIDNYYKLQEELNNNEPIAIAKMKEISAENLKKKKEERKLEQEQEQKQKQKANEQVENLMNVRKVFNRGEIEPLSFD